MAGVMPPKLPLSKGAARQDLIPEPRGSPTPEAFYHRAPSGAGRDAQGRVIYGMIAARAFATDEVIAVYEGEHISLQEQRRRRAAGGGRWTVRLRKGVTTWIGESTRRYRHPPLFLKRPEPYLSRMLITTQAYDTSKTEPAEP